MPFDIPYTFIAGQKAKANEVNQNFLGVKQFIDILEQQGATNELDIATLESNKASINGNSGYRFQVADAINSMDAVNLNTLNDLTANSKYFIGGFDLAKQSAKSIRATAGSCYDSTMEEMITSTGTLTLNTSSAGNNVTRYIFVVWNEDTLTAQLAMSTSSSTPPMPAGFTHFRRLGQFTTNGSGNILTITKDGEFNVETKNTTNGYFSLPNGLTFQWGVISGWSSYMQDKTITFPKAFNTACFCVIPSSNVTQGDGDKGSSIGVESISTTSWVCHNGVQWDNLPGHGDGGNWGDLRVYWFAVGV